MGVGARSLFLPDWRCWNMRLSRCGAQSCSPAAVVVSSLAMLAICFINFDVAVPPTFQGRAGGATPQAVLSGAGTEPSKVEAASGPVFSDRTKEFAASTVDEGQSTWSGGEPVPAPLPPSAPSLWQLPPSLAPEPSSCQTETAGAPDLLPEPAPDVLSMPYASPTCDFCSGRWLRDNTSYPLYRVQDCPFADPGFRCQDNGHPHREYEEWRWQPSGCDLPRFRPEQLLERLRNSRLVFVGDSLGRNQWESMLCLLASGVSNKSRIYEVDGNPITKHKGFLRFRFEDWNCSVEYYRSPFLVAHGRAPVRGPKAVKSALKLDLMDWTSVMWEGADVMVFNAGHWWTNAKTIQAGVFFQEGQQVNMSMSIEAAFRISLKTWSSWLRAKVDPKRTRVFFRSFASVHYRGGTWNKGGQCHRETQPWEDDHEFVENQWTNDVIVRELATVEHVMYLNITRLTDFRKDAHPAIWGSSPPQPVNLQDCSHWCLPGVPDSWNEILSAHLMKPKA